MPAGRYIILLLLLLPTLGVCREAAGQSDPTVLILTSGDRGAYRLVEDSLRRQVTARATGPVNFVSDDRQEFDGAKLSGKGLVVAIGMAATRSALEGGSRWPVLSVLVTAQAFGELSARTDVRTSTAIYLDQPVARQLKLIRLAFPQARRVGVLAGQATVLRPGQSASSFGVGELDLVVKEVPDGADLHAVSSDLLKRIDVLLALPDPAIYNAVTVQNILLTSYRSRVPVLGYSAAYARAGAVLALYSTPEQITDQAVDVVLNWLRTGTLPRASFPTEFSISVNRHVAHSLGLHLDSEDELLGALTKSERP